MHGVVELHRERDRPLVVLDELHKPLAELRCELRRGELDGEVLDLLLRHIAQKHNPVHSEPVRNLLLRLCGRSLGRFLVESRFNLAVNPDSVVRQEIGHERLVVLAEESQLETALIVLNFRLRIGPACFGVERSGFSDESSHADLFPGLTIRTLVNPRIKLPERTAHKIVEFKAVFVKWVCRKIHSYEFLFLLKEYHIVHLIQNIRDIRSRRFHFLHLAEKRNRRTLGILTEKLTIADESVKKGVATWTRGEELLFGYMETLKCPGINQGLHRLAVYDAGHPFDEVIYVCELSVPCPFADDGLHDVGAEALDASEAEADVSLSVDGEGGVRLIDVRIENLDAALLAVIHDFLDLVHLREVVAQVSRLELGRIVSLEPARLVTDPGVAGGVGLVEGVLRELLPVLPDFVESLFRVTVLHPARHELFFQGVKDVNLLLSHSLSQFVGLTFGEVRQFLRKKHDLLLIDRDSVGILEELLHLRKVIFHGLLPLLSGDE